MSQFFVALDDEIMKLFGGDTISGLMTRFNMPEDIPLQHPLVSRAIEQAQVKVEGYNFDIRKHLVEYDDVINKQREIIYSRRKTILEGDDKSDDLKKEILDKIHVHQTQPPPTENPLNRSGVSESAAGSNIVQETSSNTEKLSGAKSAP